MAKRKKLTKKGSKKLFTATGLRTNSLNLQAKPMRGGWRL